jgi:Flp pilus assembly pilin Flp
MIPARTLNRARDGRLARLRRLRRDKDGIAVTEFAFVAPIFLLVLMGIFDQGFAMYIQSTLQGAVQDGARRASLENTQWTDIEAAVNRQIRNVVPSGDPNTEISFTLASAVNQNYNELEIGEYFVDKERAPFVRNYQYDGDEAFTDANSNGIWDPGEAYTDRNRGVKDGVRQTDECFWDQNNNSQHDDNIGTAGQRGMGQDVVSITATLRYKRIFPFWKMIGQSQDQVLTASTFLRNQPFSVQTLNVGVKRGPLPECA